jgi:ABC-2 type transport system permease protein
MMRGLWKLTWLEIKVFIREPLGLIGTVLIPVAVFLVLGRSIAGAAPATQRAPAGSFLTTDLPVLAVLLMILSALMSLVTIVSIYLEGGILKRLRATPLHPNTILTAHVLVKLLFTAVTFVLLMAAGRRYYPVGLDLPVASFVAALLYCTICLLSLGFLVASIIPTARFAQPIASLVLYPMIAVSGLFFPIAVLPPLLRPLAHVLPLTPAVSLLRGVLQREPWSAHAGDMLLLALVFIVCTALAGRLFRWE